MTEEVPGQQPVSTEHRIGLSGPELELRADHRPAFGI
jgi:hypothetical protein